MRLITALSVLADMGSPQPHDLLLFQFHRDCHCEAPSTGYKLSLINMGQPLQQYLSLKFTIPVLLVQPKKKFN